MGYRQQAELNKVLGEKKSKKMERGGGLYKKLSPTSSIPVHCEESLHTMRV